jgi:hypothetical protein
MKRVQSFEIGTNLCIKQSLIETAEVGGSVPTQRDCPRPAAVVWPTASYVSVPERETMPACERKHVENETNVARLVDVPRHDANLALAGLDNAGAVGA